jgi:hypothetical protein
MDIEKWLAALEDQIALLREYDVESAISDRIRSPDAEHLAEFIETLGLSADDELVRFYQACDGISLMSVHNGYHLSGVTGVLRRMDDDEGLEPSCLETDPKSKILVFGTDGGGSRFARRVDGSVLYLPSRGAVIQGVYCDVESPVVPLASTFAGFLERLLEDVAHFVAGDHDWRYMAR